MTVFPHVWISLKRNLGKTLLLFSLVLILGSGVAGAILASQAVLNAEKMLRMSLPPVATIELHLPDDIFDEPDVEIEFVTLDLIHEIAELPYVALADYSFHHFWESSRDANINIYPVAFRTFLPSPISYLMTQHVRRSHFIDLNTGLIRLVDGRTFTEAEMTTQNDVFPVVVSREFSELNQLNVGSFFYLDSVIRGEFVPTEDGLMIMGMDEIARLQFEFEIIGIFELTREISAGDNWANDYSTAVLLNRLYTPTWVSFKVEELSQLVRYERYDWWELQEIYQDHWFQLAFLLYDPLDLPHFEVDASARLPAYWEVVTLSNIFATMTGAMETIRWIAENVVLFISGVAIVVLTLIVVLNLHDRKFEVGVYLALGKSRWKIVLQFMLEVLMIGGLALALSLLTGQLLARTFSEQFLYQELIHQEELRTQEREDTSFLPMLDPLHWFSPGNMSIEEMMVHYEVRLDVETVFIFYGLGVLVLVLSSIIPTIYLFRLSASKILLHK